MDGKTQHEATGAAAIKGLLFAGAFLGMVFLWMHVGTDPVRNPLIRQPGAAAKQKPADDGKTTPERFAVVAQVFRSQGLTVEPFDPAYPATMRVILPLEAAMNTTPLQTRELAGTARTRLGSDAIVYIKTPAGQLLAKATPWGME